MNKAIEIKDELMKETKQVTSGKKTSGKAIERAVELYVAFYRRPRGGGRACSICSTSEERFA